MTDDRKKRYLKSAGLSACLKNYERVNFGRLGLKFREKTDIIVLIA